jgi:hypothetical protein
MSGRRQLAERSGVVALVLILLGGAGGAVAAAAIGSSQVVDDSLRSRDVKDGTLRLQDLAPATVAGLRAPAGTTGPAGARGEKGEKGEKGEQGTPGGSGPTSIAETVAFYGPVQSIAPNSQTWVFAGAPVMVSTTTAHPRVTSTASAALGYAVGSSDDFADLGLCYRLSSGGIVLNFYGGNFTQHGFTGARQPYTATGSIVLSPNSYLVGLCVRNSSNKPINNNNYVNGWAQVTQ